jgi:hypothetical protein
MRLPNDTQRHSIYGKTGSGKTVAGLWALERRRFDRKPWVILDFKRDKTIGRIPRLDEIDITDSIPRKPGIYVTRPLPNSDDDVESFLWKVWERGNTGLFLDEGYMVSRFSKAWAAILTQGRSMGVPVITLSQRPSWLSPFLMSETDFHQVFFLQNPADVAKMQEWVPYDGIMRQDYHSYYYDVAKGALDYLAPVPSEDEIIDRFDAKMPLRIRLFHGLGTNAKRAKLPK